jgi:homoserine dehydrogenase
MGHEGGYYIRLMARDLAAPPPPSPPALPSRSSRVVVQRHPEGVDANGAAKRPHRFRSSRSLRNFQDAVYRALKPFSATR